jgi:outer membrane lipoprotein SlyB
MAQQRTDQTGGAGISQAGYTGISNPEFVGGSIDPNTGNLLLPTKQDYSQGQAPTPPSSATPTTPAATPTTPTAPTPASSTTQLGQLGNDTTAAAPSTKQLLIQAGKGIANTAAPYLGATVGGSIGSQVGGGASFGEAALNTTQNIGDVLKSGYSPTAATDSFINGAGQFGDLSGAAGAGIGTALVTAGIGALTGQQPKTYLPAAAESGAGSYVGSLAGGALGNIIFPGVGGVVGSELGAAAGAYLGPVIAKDVSPAISSAEKAVGNFVNNDIVKPVESTISKIGSFLGHIF